MILESCFQQELQTFTFYFIEKPTCCFATGFALFIFFPVTFLEFKTCLRQCNATVIVNIVNLYFKYLIDPFLKVYSGKFKHYLNHCFVCWMPCASDNCLLSTVVYINNYLKKCHCLDFLYSVFLYCLITLSLVTSVR